MAAISAGVGWGGLVDGAMRCENENGVGALVI